MAHRSWCVLQSCCLYFLVSVAAPPAAAQLDLGPQQIIQAGGADMQVNGFSVPCYADWNNDGLMDLIIGEGGSSSAFTGVRVYLNEGAASDPQFSGYSYVQADGADLAYDGSACPACFPMSLFPRAVYWDDDGLKDLLVGQFDGTVKIYLNVGTDEDPTFDAGTFLEAGPAGMKTQMFVGATATPAIVDWNNDGSRDLLVGNYTGRLHLFLNQGTDALPDFAAGTLLELGGAELVVPTMRSAPVVLDLDGDGRKDILSGNREGQLLLYSNVGTDTAPAFSGYTLVQSEGVPIDLGPDFNARPFVCDWTGDGRADVLVGLGDGQVYLYQGVPEPTVLTLLTFGGSALIRRNRRSATSG